MDRYFDGKTTGSKTLTAVWTVPDGYKDDEPTTIRVVVDVSVAQTVTLKEITSFTSLDALTLSADEGIITLDQLKLSGKLPAEVIVTDGITPVAAEITNWTGTFSGSALGAKTFTAEWTMPDGYKDDISQINVIIKVYVTTVQTASKEITGYTPLAAISLNSNEHITTLDELKASGLLPATVSVTDGIASANAVITDWSGTFDGTSTGAKTLTADWVMPNFYKDETDTITVTVVVNVFVAQTPSKEVTVYLPFDDVNLDANERIMTFDEILASGKLPTAVTISDGTATTSAAITGWAGTFDGTATGSYTLKAIWTMPKGYKDEVAPISVTVTINVNVIQTNIFTVNYESSGGSTVNPVTVSYGNKITAPAAPQKAGYSFAGWYKDAVLTSQWQFNTDIVTDNITLYAKWVSASGCGSTGSPSPGSGGQGSTAPGSTQTSSDGNLNVALTGNNTKATVSPQTINEIVNSNGSLNVSNDKATVEMPSGTLKQISPDSKPMQITLTPISTKEASDLINSYGSNPGCFL